jgi:hypothetical protein
MSALAAMPKNSKVWVFQSDRHLNNKEVEAIIYNGEIFLKNWTSHEVRMKANIEVQNKVFVVVALDENLAGASGCGIDKLMKFIQTIGNELNIDFFNRLKIAYLKEGNEIEFFNASSIDVLLEKEILNNDTIIFSNHEISTLDDLETKWKQKLKESWLSHNYSSK